MEWLPAIEGWLPSRRPLRVLLIGCGEGEEAAALADRLGGPEAVRMVGVDLDELALARAQARVPWARFRCADAATLPPGWEGGFDLIVIRRPDLLAQPSRWRAVFARLPGLLAADGRLICTTISAGEARWVRHELSEAGWSLLHEEIHPEAPEEAAWLVAAPPAEPETPSETLEILPAEEPGLWCDWSTGRCGPIG
ncbi:class I SAM-dependent methyltransferase [Thermoflexus hugenholtzii]